jgi:uncharacterized protein (TIGR03790 family)
VLSAVVAFGVAGTCLAELQRSEIVIVAARGNSQSEGLAKYYARVRGIPAENICTIEVPREEVCPRQLWRWAVRPEINKWLTEHDPQQRIKCLVTVWGTPLKIGPAEADKETLKYRQFLEAERTHRLKLLNQLVDKFQSLAQAPAGNPTQIKVGNQADVAAAPNTDLETQRPATELSRVRPLLENALQGAQARISKLPASEERSRAQQQLQQWATSVGGFNILLPALKQSLSADSQEKSKIQSEFDAMRGRLTSLMETKLLLEQMSMDVERDVLVLSILERAGGLLASVEWLDQQLDVVKKNETGSSFDSELSLVMWPDSYQLLRWQPNYLRSVFSNSQLPHFYRTLMVSRLDAPTIELAKGLVDAAIETERKGLRGKVYIDARGLTKNGPSNQPPGAYPDYDQSLLNAAKQLEQDGMTVVVDDTAQLFQPGQCPDAALYCGWYSLGKYVDAFKWLPGSVAYHLASSEASTLRDPKSEVWCKKLLEHGVCATIGPVYEPYLAAFPRPDEFLPLLVRGDLTLVECYYQTNPFNSWMMTLIGDPLYRPFKYRVATAQKTVNNTNPPADRALIQPLPVRQR